MTEPLSAAELAEIRAREQAATPGPWHAESIGSGVRHLDRNCDWYAADLPDGYNLPGRQGVDGGQNDGEFIAHARTDVPRLLAEVERWQSFASGLERQNAEQHKRIRDLESQIAAARGNAKGEITRDEVLSVLADREQRVNAKRAEGQAFNAAADMKRRAIKKVRGLTLAGEAPIGPLFGIGWSEAIKNALRELEAL